MLQYEFNMNKKRKIFKDLSTRIGSYPHKECALLYDQINEYCAIIIPSFHLNLYYFLVF